MADCLSLLERGDYVCSPSATFGAKAGCPFCLSRCGKPPSPGAQALLLNGYRAGSVDYCGENRYYGATDLYAELPLPPLPGWLSPFDMRTSFILDDVSVWFCNEGIVGSAFHWTSRKLITVAWVCWSKRIAITGEEMATLLLAHGMPDRYQTKACKGFEFARTAMIHAGRREPVKNKRDRYAFSTAWADAMRQWGRP